VGALALRRRPWGRNCTLFAVILNVFLRRNFDQSMLKMRIFWEKNCNELPFASGGSALLLPPYITTLLCSFLVLNAFYSVQERTK